MSETSKSVDDLPLEALESRIRSLSTEIGNTFDVRPGRVTLEVVYINGSFGAHSATVESDIDVTVGVLNNPAVEDIHHDQWIELAQRLSSTMDPVGGHPLDIQVFPTADAIEHVKQRSKHSGYETVYNLGGRRHVSVSEL